MDLRHTRIGPQLARSKPHRWLVAAAVGVLALASVGAALAATVTLTAGSLSMTAPSPAWSATLNGLDQSVNGGTTTTVVNDSTGSGAGWHVTLSATTFTTGTVTLPTGALTVNGSNTSATGTTAPAATCATGSTCTLPSGGTAVTYPLTITTAGTSPTAYTLYSAGASSGMGTIDLATNYWMAIPANAKAGIYNSTLTFAVVSAP